MLNKLLYIFDDSFKSVKKLRCLKITPETDLLLCPVTINGHVTSEVVRKLKLAGYSKIEVLDYVLEFNQLSFEEKEEYIKFIADTGSKNIWGQKNLKEHFKHPRCKWSFWWQSLLSEKNPLKSTSFKDLIKLQVILKFKKVYDCQSIVFDMKNNGLAQSLSDNANSFGYIFYDFRGNKNMPWLFTVTFNIAKASIYCLRIILRSLIARVVLGKTGISLKNKEQLKYLLVAPFPFAENQALSEKIYYNKFFSNLQKELDGKKNKEAYSFLGLAMITDKLNYLSLLGLARKFKKWKNPLSVDIEHLGFKEYVYIFYLYFYICFKYVAIIPKLINEFSYCNGEKIWSIFRRDWMKSFSGTTLMNSLFYYFVFKKVFKKLQGQTTIIHLAENLGWEKMLNIAAKENKNLKTVGCQQTTVPLQFLNYFNHSSELEDCGHINSLPIADYIGCVGDIPAKILCESGLNPEKIFVWGSMRHGYLKNLIKDSICWSKRKNSILVALPMQEEEAKEILEYVCQAFQHQKNIKIFIRGHYAGKSVEKLCRKYLLKLNRDIFEITDRSLLELLKIVKVVIVSGSTVALEAIASGVVAITPLLTNMVDLNPLTRISSFGVYVSSFFELKDEVDKVFNSSTQPLPHNDCVDFIKKYFYFLNDDETFLGRLKQVVSKDANLMSKYKTYENIEKITA